MVPAEPMDKFEYEVFKKRLPGKGIKGKQKVAAGGLNTTHERHSAMHRVYLSNVRGKLKIANAQKKDISPSGDSHLFLTTLPKITSRISDFHQALVMGLSEIFNRRPVIASVLVQDAEELKVTNRDAAVRDREGISTINKDNGGQLIQLVENE